MDDANDSRTTDNEVTRVSAEEETVPSQPAEHTGEIEYDSAKTISKDSTGTLTGSGSTDDKTSLMFGKEEIRRKMQEDLSDIPEINPEELEQEYLSSLIKSQLPNRTEEERLKINRNFLRDAEPFKIERLMEDLKNAPQELLTGFSGLDQWIRIPQRKITLIASRPRHGKTAFMLNMLINMGHTYQKKHFLFYSYNEPKQDVEIKLINMSGQKPFPPQEGINTNVDSWKYELKHRDIQLLTNKAEKEVEYIGLKRFLEISSRIHVMDASYNITDLIDSIQAFNRTLPLGAVFIDYLQAIRPDKNLGSLPRQQQLQDITAQLRELGNEAAFPVIVGAQFSLGDSNTPEYDGLSVDRLQDCGDPEQAASLIIGLQNYSQSIFIGSNINNHFKSSFYNHPLKKAEKMPDMFKEKHSNTVILAKVLANQGKPQPEVELLFNKKLLKISDLKEGAVSTA